MIKGLDRCRYISETIDEIDQMIWVKDKNNNLLFSNKAAMNFFEKLNENGIIKCPIDINSYHKDKEVEINGKWLRYSSIPVHESSNFPEGILIMADDITEEKEEEARVLNILNEKLIQWGKEKKARAERLSDVNKNIYNSLDIDNSLLEST